MLENLALFGDFLSGIAIIFSAFFISWQIRQHYTIRHLELNTMLAEYFRSPITLKGISTICNVLQENPTREELVGLDEGQKEAINSVMVGLKSHGIMAGENPKRLPVIKKYYQMFPNDLQRKLKIIALVMSEDGKSIHRENYWIDWMLTEMSVLN